MMDLRAFLVVVAVVFGLTAAVSGNVLFQVHNKFKLDGRERSLSAMRSHDVRRHGRLLSAIDLPLGGNGNPSETGLYFAKIGIGTPPKDYYVQVDTGSDILWVNCAGCDKCPTKSDLGIDLTLYDPKSSSTGKLVTCNQDFCTSTNNNGPLPYCKPDLLCQYNVVYGDGSSTTGYFVKDYVQLNRVTGSLQTSSTNGSIIFGCGAKQSGELGSSSEALDGILGFGQANSSILSQLASAGKVKKMFAHCLDGINGGGIFAIGDVVQPKAVTNGKQYYEFYIRGLFLDPCSHISVDYLPIQSLASQFKAVEVGGDVLQLPTDVFDTADQKGTIIDSGTTLAYLPEEVYDPLLKAIISRLPQLKLHTVDEQFTCFQYTGSVDDGFPVVKFYFDGSLTLTVYPREYLFQIREDAWCFGWQNSGMQTKDGKDMTLLGDLVLSNKLVLYDLENQVIGWTEYNCSSGIKVKDENSGAVYTVGSHDLSSSSTRLIGGTLIFLLMLINMLHSLL